MQRLLAALGSFIEALGQYPADDVGLGIWRDLEFPRTTDQTPPAERSAEAEALRLAS